MTLPRMEAIEAHWRRVPPPSVGIAMIGAALGVKVRKPHEKKGDLAELAAMLGSMPGFAVKDGHD